MGHHVLRRSTERSGYHPRVKNTPFTSRSSVSTLFSGQEESRDGEKKKAKNLNLHLVFPSIHYTIVYCNNTCMTVAESLKFGYKIWQLIPELNGISR